MKTLAAPSLLVAIVATQAACYPVCIEGPVASVEPRPPQSARIAEGDWVLELDDISRDGRCGDIDHRELRRLHAFVEHRGQRGLFIDIEGLRTRGEQHGPELETYGFLDEDIAAPEEPHRGDDTDYDDTDYDDGEETREGPPGEAAAPHDGVAVTLSGLADGPRWMDGALFIDLYQDGDVTCTISAGFSGYPGDVGGGGGGGEDYAVAGTSDAG